jgi:hypothetical protein
MKKSELNRNIEIKLENILKIMQSTNFFNLESVQTLRRKELNSINKMKSTFFRIVRLSKKERRILGKESLRILKLKSQIIKVLRMSQE